MTAPYSAAYKKEVLEYAKNNGVMAAGRHYSLPHATITRWNQTLKIYPPQTAEYPKERRIEILKYAAAHGKLAAAQHFNVSSSIIDTWNRTLKICGSTKRYFSKENKIEILEYARDYGLAVAAEKYDVHAATIVTWNNALHVYKLARPYTEKEKVKILTFARDNGITAAEQEFDVPGATMLRWNKTLNIYTPRVPAEYRDFTKTEKIHILKHALRVYNILPAGEQSANRAFILVAPEYKATEHQLSNWNKKYKIVPTRAHKKTHMPQETIDEAQAALTSSRGHIARASRRSGISVRELKKLQTSKKISFERGQRAIKTNPPVGRRKVRAISELVQMLLNNANKEKKG